MKIAVCWYGFVNDLQYYEYLNQYIISPLNADLIIHSWNDPQIQAKKITIESQENFIKDHNRYFDLISEHYNYNLDEYKNRWIKAISQIYSKRKAVELALDYDYIILTRPELAYSQTLHINTDYLNIPSGHDHAGICDLFVHGTTDKINIYTQLYYTQLYYTNMYNVLFPWERALRHHLIDVNRMIVRREKFPIYLRGIPVAGFENESIDNKQQILEESNRFL